MHAPKAFGEEVIGFIRMGVECLEYFWLSLQAVMSFYCYIIYSKALNRYYTGYTTDMTTRLEQHNSGVSEFTSKAKDWELVYQEEFEDRERAHKREIEIKRKKSRKYIEWLISQG